MSETLFFEKFTEEQKRTFKYFQEITKILRPTNFLLRMRLSRENLGLHALQRHYLDHYSANGTKQLLPPGINSKAKGVLIDKQNHFIL